MKKRIIGIIICAVLALAIIVLLICNWAGAFKPRKAQAATVPKEVAQYFRQSYGVGSWQAVPIFTSAIWSGPSNYVCTTIDYSQQNIVDIGDTERWRIIGGGRDEWSVELQDLKKPQFVYTFTEEGDDSDTTFYNWYQIGSSSVTTYITTISDYKIKSISDGIRNINNIYMCSITSWYSNAIFNTSPNSRQIELVLNLSEYIFGNNQITVNQVGNITLEFTLNFPQGAAALPMFQFLTTGNMAKNITSGAQLLNTGYNLAGGFDVDYVYEQGYTAGQTQGYQQGYNDGYNSAPTGSSDFDSAKGIAKILLSNVFDALGDVKLFGIFSILDIVGLALALGLILFIMRLIRG